MRRPRRGSRLVRTWSLTRVLAGREFRIRYRQSALEVVWSLVTPVAIMAVYGLVLTRVFDVQGGGVPYLSLAWSGMVVWTMFSTAVGSGVYAIISNGDLISKVYFPREVLPLAVVGASVFDLLIGGVVLLVLVAVQVRGVSIAAIAVVPAFLVLIVWTAACTIFVGVLAAFVRDVVHLTRLLLTVGFFATPVMYGTNDLPPGFTFLNKLNPLAVCIAAIRDALLEKAWPNMWHLALQGVVGLVVLVAAVAYTRRVEDRMVDVL